MGLLDLLKGTPKLSNHDFNMKYDQAYYEQEMAKQQSQQASDWYSNNPDKVIGREPIAPQGIPRLPSGINRVPAVPGTGYNSPDGVPSQKFLAERNFALKSSGIPMLMDQGFKNTAQQQGSVLSGMNAMDELRARLKNAPRKAGSTLGGLLQDRNLLPENSPERDLYNNAIAKQNHIAPNAPKLVKVQNPDGTVTYMPQSQAAGENAPVAKGMRLSIGKDGEIDFAAGDVQPDQLTKQNKTKVQDRYFTAATQLMNLNALTSKYSEKYLTYEGELKSMAGHFLGKLGIDDELVDFGAERTSFVNEARQLFNDYRREITGAAASEKEMEDLLKSMMNVKMNPKEFMSAYEQFKDKAMRNMKFNAELSGFDFNPDKYTGKVDTDILSAADKIIEAEGL
ncbi:MAG: hypothetical protein COB23_07140 [Methylophaga sp.]|nr:MAG: hypothetical protein COB23_07140 [Methylophaga sp.]